MTTLQSRAMLVNLVIHQWTARKTDKKVAKQVEAQHGAVDAGRYNKLLVNKAYLEPISRAAGRLRDYHYERTLPWGDNGDRLLPSSLFFEYTKEIGKLKVAFNDAVLDFGRVYPTEVTNARQRLGTMYDPKDYPAHITDRFDVETSFLPVPDAVDFRVDVGAEALDEIRASITTQMNTRQAEAMRSCWRRIAECLDRIIERMSEPDPIFRDSLIENLQAVIDLAPALNITNDQALIDVCEEIKSDVIVSPHRLRASSTERERLWAGAIAVKERIDVVLAR